METAAELHSSCRLVRSVINPQVSMVTEEEIRSAVRSLRPPEGALTPGGVGERMMVRVDDGRVTVTLEVEPREAARWEPFRRLIEETVAAMPGVRTALAVLTSERARTDASPVVQSTAPSPSPGAAPGQSPPQRFANLAGVRRIIAVASGKGGVGKSTTAVNLALALKARGLAVGLVDADVHGPSVPRLLGLKGQPKILAARTLEPMSAFGISAMSMGLLVDAAKAMIWRGPMVASAITQMLRDVAWGALDVLVVDMPPGTGDAQLTLAQSVPLDGAVIVSTPQDLALIDARRGVAMFRDVGVPILGIVENMSYFVCDQCDKRHAIFGSGGARVEAARLGVPLLGELPLDPAIRERSDLGLPILVADPDGPVATLYAAIADAVWRIIDTDVPSARRSPTLD